ncbi:hypothetical protein L6164_012844 [Bauhinia variegata]|nr:hypothetical protein L6164_012844 [Bauhinia variegata]
MVDHGHGITILKTLAEFEQWREHVMKKGFDVSFKEYHEKVVSTTHRNTNLEIPFVVGKLPETINCPVCPRRMDIVISCKCCHIDNVRKS